MGTYVAIFCCLFLIVHAQDGKDLASLYEDVFGNPSTSAPVTSAPGLNLQPVENHGGQSGSSGTDNCVCVAYYLCNNGSVNTNGEGVIDIRINEGPCGNQYLDVCCDASNTLEEPVTPPPTRSTTGCGYRNIKGAGFRISGAKDGETEFGEFPWMTAIIKEESVDGNPVKLNVYQCGGSLIHSRAVITAAHCVAGKNNTFKIRAGEWDTHHEKELFPYQDREIESIEIHPQYYAGSLFNDIALLILKEPVDKAENIGFVCLPSQDQVVNSGRGFATGWGKDKFGKQGSYQVILKKIELPVVPNPACQDKLRTTRLGKYFKLHDSFICAGGEPKKDTCKGDGGSPFVLPIAGSDERYFQAGIVAWGIGCGEDSIPGVYANVAKFRNWIDNQMKRHNLDTSSYQA